MKYFSLLIAVSLSVFLINFSFAQSTPSFPGAEGFGAQATGGRGGKVIYVTNLEANGPGSLNAALQVEGPKYILFKVSGVIDAATELLYGDATIAGQTSPAGITVRGFVIDEVYEPEGTGDNIIIRHLRSRPYDEAVIPSPNFVLDDALRLDGASNVIVDHCSFANAIDESVQISQSRNITVQNSMFAETLGGHYDLGGMLLNYSTPELPQDNITLHHNIWNRLGGRMPELSCESPFCGQQPLNLELSNNLIWDPAINIWYNASIDPGNEDNSFFVNLNWINNYGYARNTFTNGLMSFDLLRFSGNNIFAEGNKLNLYPDYSDYEIFYCCNDFNQAGNHPNTDLGSATIRTTRHSFPAVTYTPATDLRSYMAENAGAFPRDQMDNRLLGFVAIGNIDQNPIDGVDYYHDAFLTNVDPGAYPQDSDDDGMPDYWENIHGLNAQTQDHNGSELSLGITGISGYTNLECYLNCLSDFLVTGRSEPACGLTLKSEPKVNANVKVYPNPTSGVLSINSNMPNSKISIVDVFGRIVFEKNINSTNEVVDLKFLNGIYFYRIISDDQIVAQGKLVFN